MPRPRELCGAACWGVQTALLCIQLFCSLCQMLCRTGVVCVCRVFRLTLC